MRFGIRSKLFLVLFGLIGLSILIVYSYARRETAAEARMRIEQDLVVRLRLVQARARVAGHPLDDVEAWDQLADELGSAASARVTFIARDGDVLGDSMLPERRIDDTDDHSTRPEVKAALRGEIGIVGRYSSTMQRAMFYVAGPLTVGGASVGVVRVALPDVEVRQALNALREVLLVASLLALLISVGVAWFTVQLASRRVSALTRAAARMAGGDLEVRSRVRGTGEFADLGRALDRLAKNLSTTLSALKEERDRMSAILSSMEEGVLFLDEDGRVAVVNPALRDMLLLQGDPTGRPLLEVVRHAELKEMIDTSLEEEFDDDETEETLQGEIRVFGLKPRQLLVRVKRLEGGMASGVVAVFLDVTETRRLENLRREFVANVSHELRTPVTSIRSAAETLEAAVQTQPDMAKKFVAIIDRNATRLHNLVEDVLDLSRIESRQFSMSLGPLDVGSVAAQAIGLFEEKARQREVGIRLHVAEGVPEARADRRALEHVLSNLVDNAVKYAGSGKQVTVTVRAANEEVLVDVADDGPGIDSKHLPRLFERFYRVDAGRSRDLGGTGLGLAIVKHLVESMSGRVEVNSKVGEGTRFTVHLPAIVQRKPRSLAEASSAGSA